MWRRKKVRLEEGGKVVVLGGAPARRRLRAAVLWRAFQFLVIAGVFGIVIQGSFVRADELRFYPNSCLGTWTDVAHVLGRPELSGNPLPSEFTPENSAILSGTGAQIFCGNFEQFEEEPLDDKDFKEAVLRVSWRARSSDAAPPIPEEALPDASSTEPAPTGTLPAAPLPEPEPAPPEPTSWGWFGIAWAQESEPVPEAAASGTVIASPESSTLDTLEIPFELGGGTSTPSTSTPPEALPETPIPAEQSTAPDTLEVSYSLDGNEWKELATVLADQAEPTAFRIPITSWEELRGFQVSVTARLNGSIVPNVLLDGFELQVKYETREPFAEPLPEDPQRTENGFTLDPMARHECIVTPFEISMTRREARGATIALMPSSDPAPSSTLLLGDLPPGLEGSINLQNATTATLAIRPTGRFRPGSFNVGVFYSESYPERPTSTALCQFNLVLQ